MKHVKPLASAALFLSIFASLYFLSLKIDSLRAAQEKKGERFLYLPKAEYLKPASLGYENVLADFLWLSAVQHIAEIKISESGFSWIYKALDTVTTLNPKMLMPYQVGGLMLTANAKGDMERVELSSRLLEKGVLHNPDVWQLPFYLGFNQMYFHKDYKKAAASISRAASIKGSPKYLPLISARLYVQADNPVYAYEFLARVYESTEDERTREFLLKRLNLIKTEIIKRELQKAADFYAGRTGRPPAGLAELVRVGLLKDLPEEPAGGRFYIGTGGTVMSSSLEKEKLGVHKYGDK